MPWEYASRLCPIAASYLQITVMVKTVTYRQKDRSGHSIDLQQLPSIVFHLMPLELLVDVDIEGSDDDDVSNDALRGRNEAPTCKTQTCWYAQRTC